jgi:hypothetical protein
MSTTSKVYYKSQTFLLVIGILGSLGMYLLWDFLTESQFLARHKLFDEWDLKVYFNASRWAVGQGTLYKDVFSEYPLFANLIFGLFRFLGELTHPLSSSFKSFSWLWASASWFLYLWILYQIATKVSTRSVWIWLAPAPLYFSIFRFDIYPAAISLLALFALRDQKYFKSAFWLGIAIALKGYVLFVIPAFFVFLIYKKGLFTAIKVTAFSLAPFTFSNLVVFAYSGFEGLIAPYSFHAVRSNNGESTYDAVVFLLPFIFSKKAAILPRLAQGLQITMPLIAAGLQPKKFQELVDAFLLSILGFISFSTFYSPQFCLWIAPVACFSRSRTIKTLTTIYCWITFISFPILHPHKLASLSFMSFSLPIGELLFGFTVVIMTAIRFCMMYVSFRRLWHHYHQFKNQGNSFLGIVNLRKHRRD